VSVHILIGDVREKLAELPADSFDCVVTSPPYWGLRDYGVEGQIGLEPTLGEHIAVMVDVFDAVRRVMKPGATLWLNYGDCYATKPNGRSAADTKAAGNDDRTFRDKPFSTVGGVLKPKDLCMVPNRLAIALQEAGWWVRSEIVWGKPNPMPDSSGRYRPSTAHEKIFLLSKSATCFYDSEAVAQPVSGNAHARRAYKTPDNWDTTIGDGGHGTILRSGREKGYQGHAEGKRHAETLEAARPPGTRAHTGLTQTTDKRRRGKGQRLDDVLTENPRDRDTRFLRNYEPAPLTAWNVPTAGFEDAHFATFPPALVKLCLAAGCPEGGVVLDPFGGAGTVGLVAALMRRSAILIELNADYAAIAHRRLKAEMIAVSGGDSRRGLAPLPLFGEAI
jgi:DNA modification methylase